jgi:ABC-type multidrug transport system permease subunit
MDITLNTPALLFPAISLIMLAYTNRFLALANVIRNLHERYKNDDGTTNPLIHAQIKNLRVRIRLIKNMQIFGVMSILAAIIAMYLIYITSMTFARLLFASSLLFFMISLILSLIELILSTKSLEIELSDVDE